MFARLERKDEGMMSHSLDRARTDCTSDCSRCTAAQAEGLGAGGAPSGWRLVLPSACVFLLPLATAIVGAVLLRRSEMAQAAGGVAGFVIGAAMAVVLRRFWSSKR
jgi:hypothetical protein